VAAPGEGGAGNGVVDWAEQVPRDHESDTIFIERPWRSHKYETVYLHEMTDGFQAERIIDRHL
jgi:hypothetical protein